MTAALVALAVIAAAELLVIAWVMVQRRGTARFEKRRVVIHTRRPDDQSIRGVLTGVHADCLVLSSPEWLDEAVEAAEGDAMVLRQNVSWVQVL